MVCPPERCISESGRRICSLAAKLIAFLWHDSPHLMHYTIGSLRCMELKANNKKHFVFDTS